jgi:hypothetical protein
MGLDSLRGPWGILFARPFCLWVEGMENPCKTWGWGWHHLEASSLTCLLDDAGQQSTHSLFFFCKGEQK